jgi:hypothetical protein
MHCKECGGRRLHIYNRQGGAFTYMNSEGEEGRERGFREWLAEVWRDG